MSQEKLGDAVGLTFQQIQKYERGANRVSASMLWELSKILGAPTDWFFEGAAFRGRPKDPLRTKRETLELVRAFSSCSKEVQNCLMALFRAVSEVSEPKAKK